MRFLSPLSNSEQELVQMWRDLWVEKPIFGLSVFPLKIGKSFMCLG